MATHSHGLSKVLLAISALLCTALPAAAGPQTSETSVRQTSTVISKGASTAAGASLLASGNVIRASGVVTSTAGAFSVGVGDRAAEAAGDLLKYGRRPLPLGVITPEAGPGPAPEPIPSLD